MTTKYFELSTVHLFRYKLASADMFYSEAGQRDVFLGHDEHGNFAIWGETADGDPSTKINLCEIFLEYGLYCCSWCSMDEKLYHMQYFGNQLGHSLAQYLKENPPLLEAENPAVRALEHVFRTIGACFSAEYSEGEVRFMVTDCPLENAAKHAGLYNVDLAHHGINAMCRSLILDINPDVTVNVSSGIRPEFILTITAPVVPRVSFQIQ